MMTFTSLTTKTVALSLSLLGLAACQHTNVGEPSLAETTARNSVHMVRLPFEVAPEDDGTASLSNVSITSLTSFLSSIGAGHADVIMLDGPGASSGRIEAIGDYIRERGLIYAGTSALGAEPRNGAVMLYVERYVVTTPKCGMWSEETSNDTRNNMSSFLGCSNTANLGLMVANPRDLVSGQSASNTTAAAVGAIYTPAPTAAPAAAPTVLLPAGMLQSMQNSLTPPSAGNR